jgi:hypothetical protein
VFERGCRCRRSPTRVSTHLWPVAPGGRRRVTDGTVKLPDRGNSFRSESHGRLGDNGTDGRGRGRRARRPLTHSVGPQARRAVADGRVHGCAIVVFLLLWRVLPRPRGVAFDDTAVLIPNAVAFGIFSPSASSRHRVRVPARPFLPRLSKRGAPRDRGGAFGRPSTPVAHGRSDRVALGGGDGAVRRCQRALLGHARLPRLVHHPAGRHHHHGARLPAHGPPHAPADRARARPRLTAPAVRPARAGPPRACLAARDRSAVARPVLLAHHILVEGGSPEQIALSVLVLVRRGRPRRAPRHLPRGPVGRRAAHAATGGRSGASRRASSTWR